MTLDRKAARSVECWLAAYAGTWLTRVQRLLLPMSNERRALNFRDNARGTLNYEQALLADAALGKEGHTVATVAGCTITGRSKGFCGANWMKPEPTIRDGS